jgi:5'-nucleotidase
LRILVSNDDGIHSEGLIALARVLEDLGEVFVVAPDREQSAASHSLTLHRPLRIHEINSHWFSINGTPSDCIILGVNGILRDRKPDLIASGINKGANLGDDIIYSGTVSAAREGTLLGIPSFAISIASRSDFHFDTASNFAGSLSRYILENGLPPNTVLNVNVPNVDEKEIKSYEITLQGRRIYSDVVVEKVDPRGKKYYWIGGGEPGYDTSKKGTDFMAVNDNRISITPLNLDLTSYATVAELKAMTL